MEQTITVRQLNHQNVSVTNLNNVQPIKLNQSAGVGVTDVFVNGHTVVVGSIAYITLPTKVSDLINDEHFVKTSSLSNVALSGNYNDLTNKPTIPTVPTKTSDLNNDSGYITNTVSDLVNYTKSSELSEVALSGDYDDLTNKPTIPTVPTNVSSFNNDAGYISDTDGFITKDVDDLTNYTKTEDLSFVALSGTYDDLIDVPVIEAPYTPPTHEPLWYNSTDHKLYRWNGSSYSEVGSGGGGGGTSDNVVNEYSESDTDTYSCDYENNTFVDKSSIRDSYSTGNDEAFYNCDYANEHFGGTVLYNNDSGTSGDITLSESVVNYKCIEIYFKDNNGNSPNSIKFRGSGIICLSTYEYSNNIQLRVSSYVLNGSSLTFSSGKYHEIVTGNELVGNYLKIYQVIGYK